MEGAQEAAERYVEALREGDGEAACEVLTPEAVQDLEDRVDAPCADAIAEALGAESPTSEELDDLRVGDVNAADDVATATIEGGPRGPITAELRRQDGDWRLLTPGG